MIKLKQTLLARKAHENLSVSPSFMNIGHDRNFVKVSANIWVSCNVQTSR